MATKKPKKPPKNMKFTRNKNSSRAQICCFRCFKVNKKIPKHKPAHHIESLDTRINRFGGQNLYQGPPFMFMPEFDDFLSFLPMKKYYKKRKIKLDIKMYCLEIQGTGHAIPTNYKGLKRMFQRNF
jgi:hypothetical protein